jgi:hypothetical protein
VRREAPNAPDINKRLFNSFKHAVKQGKQPFNRQKTPVISINF